MARLRAEYPNQLDYSGDVIVMVKIAARDFNLGLFVLVLASGWVARVGVGRLVVWVGIAGWWVMEQNKVKTSFSDFSPNAGPGRLPLDSGRRDVECACDSAPVASMAVSFVSEFTFWNPVEKNCFEVWSSSI